MRKFINEVTITGDLVKSELVEKTITTKDGKQVEVITGSVYLRTADKSEFEVRLYTNKFKKDSSEETYFYKEYSKFMEDMISIETAVEGQVPSVVTASSCEIRPNDYKSKNTGDVISSTVINGKFLKIESQKEAEIISKEATFTIEGIIGKIEDEMDKNSNLTGNKTVVLYPIRQKTEDFSNENAYEVDEISISPRDNDLLSPTITLKGNLLKYYDINDNYTEDGAIARDSNGEILNVEIDKSNINFSKEGIYYVLYTSTDNNNITTYAKRTIIVGSLAMPVSYEDGRAFYYNPVTNSRCKATEAVSTTGTKTGCMKWYAFLTNPESDKVNLILDHNTSTTNVKWTSYNNIKSGPNTALARLKSDVSGWCDEAKTSARMIEAQEIANITKNDKWNNKSTGGHYYYFYDNSQTEYKGAVGTNPYAWLCDNLYGCEAYGCNTSAGASHYLMNGYWTHTGFPDGFPRAWRVLDNGILVHNTANYENGSIRPVISISKKVFELN